jgi:hypothetical protein
MVSSIINARGDKRFRLSTNADSPRTAWAQDQTAGFFLRGSFVRRCRRSVREPTAYTQPLPRRPATSDLRGQGARTHAATLGVGCRHSRRARVLAEPELGQAKPAPLKTTTPPPFFPPLSPLASLLALAPIRLGWSPSPRHGQVRYAPLDQERCAAPPLLIAGWRISRRVSSLRILALISEILILLFLFQVADWSILHALWRRR